MSERSERVAETLAVALCAQCIPVDAVLPCRRHRVEAEQVVASPEWAAVLDALGDDPAQATVERVEALAWVTQDICDCDSMKGRAGAHRDECPVMVLRAALDPVPGQ